MRRAAKTNQLNVYCPIVKLKFDELLNGELAHGTQTAMSQNIAKRGQVRGKNSRFLPGGRKTSRLKIRIRVWKRRQFLATTATLGRPANVPASVRQFLTLPTITFVHFRSPPTTTFADVEQMVKIWRSKPVLIRASL